MIFKYVTKLLKFASIWLDDYISRSSTTMTEEAACATNLEDWSIHLAQSEGTSELHSYRMNVKGRTLCSAKRKASCWQARWNPFDLIYIRFSPVFAVLVSSVAPTAPWTVTSPSGRQSSNSSRGLCPAAGRQMKKEQTSSKKIIVTAKWSGYTLDVSHWAIMTYQLIKLVRI